MNSINWLFESLWDAPKDKFTWESISKKAHEMHKQEIMQSYIDGSHTGCGCYDFMKEEDAEQYYNETFKKD